MARRLITGLRGPRSRDGVAVLSPLVVPLHGNRLVRAFNSRLLPFLVGRAARRMGMTDPLLWAYVPQAEILLDSLRPATVVYHCVDDIAAQKGVDSSAFRASEERFAARADLVITSAPSLDERMRAIAAHVLYAPNVADTSLFATALDSGPVDPATAKLPAPRLIFTGAITATKLDLDLLAEVARMRPDWSVGLVGAVGAGDPSTDVSALVALPNVHLLGARPQRELPAVLRAAAIGLIPYALNELTASVFPMKVYEYLAAGVPVVATPLPALAGVAGISFAANAPATVERVEEELGADGPETRRERSRAASGHSWEARAGADRGRVATHRPLSGRADQGSNRGSGAGAGSSTETIRERWPGSDVLLARHELGHRDADSQQQQAAADQQAHIESRERQ